MEKGLAGPHHSNAVEVLEDESHGRLENKQKGRREIVPASLLQGSAWL
jgi:hypothetical protein